MGGTVGTPATAKVIEIYQMNTGIVFPPPLTPPPGAGNFFSGHFSRASAREK